MKKVFEEQLNQIYRQTELELPEPIPRNFLEHVDLFLEETKRQKKAKERAKREAEERAKQEVQRKAENTANNQNTSSGPSSNINSAKIESNSPAAAEASAAPKETAQTFENNAANKVDPDPGEKAAETQTTSKPAETAQTTPETPQAGPSNGELMTAFNKILNDSIRTQVVAPMLQELQKTNQAILSQIQNLIKTIPKPAAPATAPAATAPAAAAAAPKA